MPLFVCGFRVGAGGCARRPVRRVCVKHSAENGVFGKYIYFFFFLNFFGFYFFGENSATTAYCSELEQIEAALMHETVEELLSNSVLPSIPMTRDFPPLSNNVKSELEKAAQSANEQRGSESYSFKLKGIKHIDPHCERREMHYFRTVDGVCNWPNLSQYRLGSVGQLFGRDRSPAYTDGVDKVEKKERKTKENKERKTMRA